MVLDHGDESIVLPDGRTLGWATFGDPDGLPVLAFHGSPDSHHIWALIDQAARAHGLRLLCPDRPGFGLSDPHPGHTIAGWSEDATTLADQLGLSRFVLLAISGGGEYACACAQTMGDRVLGLGLFSVIGPLDGRGALEGTNLPVRTAYWLARRAPRVLGSVVSSMVRVAERNPEKAFARLARTRPAEDREVVLRPDVRRVLMQNLAGQFRDAASIVREFRLAVQPWPVALDRIAVPTHVWQGGRDDVHTPAMARRLASAIPNAHLTLRPEFATFNFLDDLEPMLTTICGWFEPPGRPPAR